MSQLSIPFRRPCLPAGGVVGSRAYWLGWALRWGAVGHWRAVVGCLRLAVRHE